MTTYCEDCDNVEAASRKQAPKYWLCTKYHNIREDFVRKDIRAFPPYKYCVNMNDGDCPKFKPLRKEENDTI